MRVGDHVAVAGKVLGDCHHSRLVHATDISRGQLADDFRIAMEGTIADHLAGAIVQVNHRRKTEIHAGIQHLRRHQPAAGLCQPAARRGIQVVLVAKPAQRRQCIKPFPETLDPPTFLVDGDQQLRRTQSPDLRNEIRDLPAVPEVPAEQDHGADQRVLEARSFGRRQGRAFQVHHQGAKGHVFTGAYGMTFTIVPAATASNSQHTSALRILMQPCENGTPIGSLSGVP